MNIPKHVWWTVAPVVVYALQAFIAEYLLLWRYVDHDQLVGADMARRFAEGVVPEPYFWGQPYNFPLESWLSVPVVWLGIRADVAVTLIALAFFYAPFVLAQRLIRNHGVLVRTTVAILPLVIPYSLVLVALMPRNFGTVAGVAALCTMGILFNNRSWVRISCGLVLGICVASIPSAGLLLPLLIWAPQPRRRLVFPGVGFIVTFAVISGLKIFYDVNPSYALFPGQNTSPSWDSFSVAMESQVHWQCVAMLIPAILVVSIPFIYRRWRWRSKTTRNTRVRLLVSIAGCGVLVAGLLSVPAINNHHDSLFFDFWRYWTAVPFFLLILLVASARAVPLRERLPSVTPRAMRLTSPVAVVMAGLLACGILVSQGAWLKANEFALVAADGPVAVSPREKVVQSCRDLKQRANAQNVYIALSENDPFLAYGCYALAGINVVNPAEDERRTWLQAYLRQQGMVGITNRPEG